MFPLTIRRRILLMVLLAGIPCSIIHAQPASSADNTPRRSRAATSPTTSPTVETELADAINDQRQAALRSEQVKVNTAAVREILNIGLASDESGRLLREARDRAPDLDAIQYRIESHERQIAQVRLDRVRLLEARRLTKDHDEFQQLSQELADQEAYLAALEKAVAAERELAAESGELITLLDTRLLWIVSAPSIGREWLDDLIAGVRWIANPDAWIGVAQTLLARLGETPIPSALVTLLAAVLYFMRFRIKAIFARLAANVGRDARDSYWSTLRATAITLILTLPIPLVLAGLGYLLISQNNNPFARALGSGLLTASYIYLLLTFFRLVCRAGGIADLHFGWNEHARRTLFNNLSWFLAVIAPAALVTAACDAGGHVAYRQGVGRLAFMVGTVAMAVFIARVFRPARGVFSELMYRNGWAWRLRRLWYGILVGVPIVLTIAAAAGYYYTATQIESRYFFSGVLVFSGIVIYSHLMRWVLIAHRRLAIRQARQKRADELKAHRAKGPPPVADTPSGDPPPELELPAIDITAASSQTQSLIRTLVAVVVLALLWALWKDLLPALGILQRVQLSDPTYNPQGEMIVNPVTAWSLLMSLLTIILTAIAAKNLPALLELAVLERFPLDSGVRYATATLLRYVVVAAGIIIISRLLGIDWSRAQWIIAALGVGLGFGLQEIVANFVSGLIILFERPIRVGDTVTVGDISGTVSRLQIRATTITDWDNKEVLVPNKSFITDRVVNWTLSSATTRLVLRVGVAYGSDMPAVERIITQTVAGTPNVLSNPPPRVFFTSFGDSSLTLEIYAFVAELGQRLSTLHSLHLAINDALAKAGIEIPFPQRDLNLRTSQIGRLSQPSPVELPPKPAMGDQGSTE